MTNRDPSVLRVEHLSRVPESAKGIVCRAFDGAASPRQAIKAKCLECCCYQREHITHCRAVTCPLHAYRPYQMKHATSS